MRHNAALSDSEVEGTAVAESSPTIFESDEMVLMLGDEEIPLESVEVKRFEYSGSGSAKTTFDWIGEETETYDTHILEDAIETVYDRPDTHGEPEDSFARIAAFWSDFLDTEVTETDVANMMILLKVARNAEGHYHGDNYVDIAGYAENGARLNE